MSHRAKPHHKIAFHEFAEPGLNDRQAVETLAVTTRAALLAKLGSLCGRNVAEGDVRLNGVMLSIVPGERLALRYGDEIRCHGEKFSLL